MESSDRKSATTLLPRNLDRWIYRPVNVRLKDLQLRFDVIRGFERDRFHGSTTFVMGSCLSNFLPRLVYYMCVYFDGRVVGDYDFRIKEGEEEIKDRKCSLNRFVTLNSVLARAEF